MAVTERTTMTTQGPVTETSSTRTTMFPSTSRGIIKWSMVVTETAPAVGGATQTRALINTIENGVTAIEGAGMSGRLIE